MRDYFCDLWLQTLIVVLSDKPLCILTLITLQLQLRLGIKNSCNMNYKLGWASKKYRNKAEMKKQEDYSAAVLLL